MIINNDITAETFLNEIKKTGLTGREFLALIGNSKIGTDAYLEIRDGTNLTMARLYQIFDESALTTGDYYRMLKAADEIKRKKEEKLRSESVKKLQDEIDSANKRRTEAKLAEFRAETEKKAEKPVKNASSEQAIPLNTLKSIISSKSKETDDGETNYKSSIPLTAERALKHDVEYSADHLNEKNNLPLEEGEDTLIRYKPNFTIYNKNNSSYDYDNEINDFEDVNNSDDFKENTNDETDDYDEDYSSDERKKSNTWRIVLSFSMGFVLLLSSFALRYINSGSIFLQNAGIVQIKQLETYFDLASQIFKLPDLKTIIPSFGGNFYLNTGITADNGIKTSNYTFYAYNNTLYVLDLNRGESEFSFSIIKDGMALNTYFEHDEKLYVVYDYSYDKKYNSSEHLGEETDLPSVSGISEQKATAVDVYDAVNFSSTPLLQYTLDGEFKKIDTFNGRVYIATDFTPFNPSLSDDPNAFVPFYSLNGNKNLVSIENLTISKNPVSKCITMVGFVDNFGIFGAVGGENSSVNSFGNSIFIILRQNNNTEIIRYDSDFNVNSFIAEGTIYDGAIDETDNVVRFCAENGDGVKLYILDANEEFKPLSVVENIARGEKIENILFDEQTVYIIGEKIYAMDTSIPNEPLIAERIAASIYSDDYYYWSDKTRIALEYDFEKNSGNKTGLKLTVYKLEKSEYIQTASINITVDSAISGDWDSLFRSPIDVTEYELCLIPQKNIIIMPFSYFNGISEIIKFIIFEYDDYSGLNKIYEYTEYDSNATKLSSAFSDDEQIYLFINDKIKTFNLTTVNVE